jgi:restriction system protein
MTIPDFQTVFLPLLQACSDGKEYRLKYVIETITKHFNLTEEEINERLPSGKQTVIRNRTAWSCTYLKKAGLLESKRRGFFNITDTGSEILKQNHERINVKFLKQFEGFEEFHTGKKSVNSTTKDEPTDDRTPDELMDEGYKQIHSNLAEDLLGKLRSVDPYFFEHIVGKLLSNMGYGEHEITKRSGDKGIDAIVNQDQLGLDRIFVQAKRYAKSNPVSAHEVRDFVGTLDLEGVQKGVFITTSKFPKDTHEIIAKTPKNIILIDGDKLAVLMIDYNVGVSLEKVYEIKKIDSDFFIEE